MTCFSMPARLAASCTASQITLGVMGPPAIQSAREQIGLRSHPAPVFAKREEQLLAERNITVHAVDAEKGLILLKGAVPGPKGGLVVLRSAVKKEAVQ